MKGDIVDAITRIGVEFIRLDLALPEAILLRNHDEGMRLLHMLDQCGRLTVAAESERAGRVINHPDGSVWMQAEVYGIKIRWPAVKFAKREGGYVWT